MELTPLSSPNSIRASYLGLDEKTIEQLERAEKRDKYEEYRKKVYYFLERPENKIAIFYHVLNLTLIVGSIITSILSTIDSYEDDEYLKDFILYFELGLLSWFSIEYLLRVWSCSFLGKYRGILGKLRFMKSLYMMIDAFVIVSTLTTAILSVKTAYFTILRITRFLQIFRILRLDRQRGDIRTMGKVVYKHRKELVTCYFVGFIILFGGTYLIYIIEKVSSDDSTIDNMANGLYWAMITVTSVGYGDISPKTWAGKILTGVFALVGCAFFALPAGILGSGFALQVAKQKKQKRYIKVRNPAALVIQTFWRNYSVMPQKYQLQGTWHYFFPQLAGRANNPAYYELLPGVQSIVKSDFLTEANNSYKPQEKKRNKLKRFLGRSKSEEQITIDNNGCFGTLDSLTIQQFSHRKSSSGSRRLSSASRKHTSHRKKSSHADVPLASILNKQYKEAIRFILRVRLFHCIKVFKNVRYPFVNVQDIMEKNALCHTETLSYLKHIQESLEEFKLEMQEIRMVISKETGHEFVDLSSSIGNSDGDAILYSSFLSPSGADVSRRYSLNTPKRKISGSEALDSNESDIETKSESGIDQLKKSNESNNNNNNNNDNSNRSFLTPRKF